MAVAIPPDAAPGVKFQVQMPASQGGRKQSNPSSLFGRFNRTMSNVNKKMHKAAGEATKEFHAVTAQCPRCSAVVNVTKENAKEKFFTCPQCRWSHTPAVVCGAVSGPPNKGHGGCVLRNTSRSRGGSEDPATLSGLCPPFGTYRAASLSAPASPP
jgi:hypothetical protein